jgi:hypothetical protein
MTMNRLNRMTVTAVAVGLLMVPALRAEAGGIESVHWADAWKRAGGAVPSTALNSYTLWGGAGTGQWINRDLQTKSVDSSAKDSIPGIYCSAAATVLHLTEPSRFPACNQPFFIDEGRLATLPSNASHTG